VGKRLDIYFWCRLGYNAPMLGMMWRHVRGALADLNKAASHLALGNRVNTHAVQPKQCSLSNHRRNHDTTRQQHLL
jgi:hypothetical protein